MNQKIFFFFTLQNLTKKVFTKPYKKSIFFFKTSGFVKPNLLKINGSNINIQPKRQVVVQSSSSNQGDTKFKTNRIYKEDKFVSIAYEEIGLFPRSFSRVLERFLKQVFTDVETLVVQEYRFFRYLFLTTIKTILILFFIPLLLNIFAKTYFVHPITEFFWNTIQTDIFLNTYQQTRAFTELKEFEDKLYFESLLLSSDFKIFIAKTESNTNHELLFQNPNFARPNGVWAGQNKSADRLREVKVQAKVIKGPLQTSLNLNTTKEQKSKSLSEPASFLNNKNSLIKKQLQDKTIELAVQYNDFSIDAITNFISDLLSFFSLLYLLFSLQIQINITKSFLLEVFFGLDDSQKSLLILLVTDLLVGYHSPNIWELFFQFLFNHYGIPESETVIFLLVATLPVLLDVLFKYLIFRHLNRSSPATVATYHALIE